jgi:hypothetical protein
MSTNKVVLGTLAGLIATASSCYAMPTASTEDGIASAQRLSAAAREQVLNKSLLQLAAVNIAPQRVFLQEKGPSFVQWRAQMKSKVDSSRPTPAGDVRATFEEGRNLIG